ncbi:MAG: Eco57I restriction-modification methylase domain-containing protein, partial [Sulfurihydrogenibium sp.]
NIGMDILKVKLKGKTINDVASMSLYPSNANLLAYLISLLNSRFLSYYQFNFINNTVNLQINDIRQLPIIIPTPEQLKEFEDIFNRAVSIQKQKFKGKISEEEAEKRLEKIQRELDEKVLRLYELE